MDVDFFCPEEWTTAYPLHFTCLNRDCPSLVIELLIEKYRPALSQICKIEGDIDRYDQIDEGVPVGDYEYIVYACEVEGLPLHYSLSGTSGSMDLNTVKILVEAYHDALTSAW
mmetsp:Transcript_6496/g.11444  ORF Transcript_6496/g.11444 Transcript_6496/m.11444 type:complete len:113 (+) Transcript_6496:1411-1749(+)|eukprot:CAMPEP_0201902854 /NCGR_PEP_ID=MMETSP0902-20130614/55170_1 /ASSEMBLY_ACC=CAM_ASM_000551 /TAXON_ID=420261 /ORGANISM="Thalassiosira antarctica, Strain CCMP982" /LENGTH=112 /DNA_ID=CAMNT_0048436871 /DNA_START=2055 /DNA_END=2390 /DNA_ORIENTATION=+